MLAYLLGSYPGKVEAFVRNEMKEIIRQGFIIYVCPIHYISMDNKNEDRQMPGAIYEGPPSLSSILFAHLFFMFCNPSAYFECLFKYKIYGGKRAFLKSAYFAWKIKRLGIKHIHAHFAWTATDSARMISRLINIPFSFSAHAADIYYIPDRFEEKLREAKFVITCVQNNKTYISKTFGQALGQKVEVVYHGVNVEKFKPPRIIDKSIDVLSIANLVEKKGHRYLIEACSILKQEGIVVKCVILGEGPEKERLSRMIKEFGLERSVEFKNRCSQNEMPSIYADSKIFVLASIITDSGDRDGIPNVLAEAMAMGLPVISTDLPNITELIKNGETGLLVTDSAPGKLAQAIEKLLGDQELRNKLGTNARAKIVSDFDAKKHAQKIANLFAQVA
jgi:glycosyltransferase involved in cell wall biosynthesis